MIHFLCAVMTRSFEQKKATIWSTSLKHGEIDADREWGRAALYIGGLLGGRRRLVNQLDQFLISGKSRILALSSFNGRYGTLGKTDRSRNFGLGHPTLTKN